MSNYYRLVLGLLLIPLAGLSFGYPIDGYEETGIRRLDYYQRVQTEEIKGTKLFEGAKLDRADVVPQLVGLSNELPAVNAEISKQLAKLIPSHPERYSIAVLDMSDVNEPIYAEHNLSLIHI